MTSNFFWAFINTLALFALVLEIYSNHKEKKRVQKLMKLRLQSAFEHGYEQGFEDQRAVWQQQIQRYVESGLKELKNSYPECIKVVKNDNIIGTRYSDSVHMIDETIMTPPVRFTIYIDSHPIKIPIGSRQ